MSIELASCPFCPDGGNPHFHSEASIRCNGCNTIMHGVQGTEELARVWNERAELGYPVARRYRIDLGPYEWSEWYKIGSPSPYDDADKPVEFAYAYRLREKL